MNISAQSKEQLLELLKASDITVLPRGDGRTKLQVERWVMFRALATLAYMDKLEYPISLEKSERPDYVLGIRGNHTGCEITEAINGEYIKSLSLPEAKKDGAIIDVSLFKWNEHKRKLDKLRQIASRIKLTGPGWRGNEVEIEYAKIISDVTQTKTKNLNSPGFTRFSENYLLIYCNQSLPILDIDEASKLCRQALTDYWSPSSFSRIFVEKAQNIAVYDKDGYEVYSIEDIWM